MPLPPARSEKGNENRGNPRNPLPFSACEAGKGNENRGNPQNSLPFSAITAEVIFIQEKEKNIKFVKNACEK